MILSGVKTVELFCQYEVDAAGEGCLLGVVLGGGIGHRLFNVIHLR